jgi:hypothetical protein
MDSPWIDPNRIFDLTAAACGAFLTILFRRGAGLFTVLTTIITSEMIAYFFAEPLWGLAHGKVSWMTDDWRGPVDLTLGLVSIFVVGGTIKLGEQFMASPTETVAAIFRWIIDRFAPRRP